MSKRVQPHIFMGRGDTPPYVILTGDPKRVARMAEKLESATKVADYRQYVTYRGVFEGVPVAITSTGIGCPAAAIAVEELAKIGAEVFIRVGTTGALQPGIEDGDLVIATAAVRADGTTRAYIPPEYPAVADPDIVTALRGAAEKVGAKYWTGVVWTSDAFYAEDPELVKFWSRANVKSVEMECSAIFTLASLKGLRAGAVLVVDGNLVTGEKKGEFEAGEKKFELSEAVQGGIAKATLVALKAIKELDEKLKLARGR